MKYSRTRILLEVWLIICIIMGVYTVGDMVLNDGGTIAAPLGSPLVWWGAVGWGLWSINKEEKKED